MPSYSAGMLTRARERDSAWLCACALLVYCAALVSAAAERETQFAQAPFIMGSRFGRSSPPRLMMPRNDKFFFSSRYGKRSPPPLEPPDASPALGPAPPRARPADLLCEYTGVRALYRCRPSDLYQDSRRLGGSSSEEE